MEEKKENAAPECRKNNDLRTFFIALLTAIVVVALYHFGSGLYKIFCTYDCDSGYYPSQRYMLVPVMDMPMMPGMGEGHGHRHGHGKFGMKRPRFHEGAMKPGLKRGPGFKGKHPAKREPGAVADARASEVKPAPKAAENQKAPGK